MSNYAVETKDLGRVYKIRGNKKERQERKELLALEDVNLTVERGELFGLLGPNGAGKTTLLFAVTSVFIFRWCDHRARERGLIDSVTNY